MYRKVAQVLERLGKNLIVGNDKLCTRLYSDIRSKSLSHAYIIEGARGSGRHTLAYAITSALACTGETALPCLECKNCRDIFAGICPDVITIGRGDKASLGIDAIRELKSTVGSTSNNLDFKAYILEDADTMTLQAQNAFLLTLEQPPQNVYFFILCENARSLLETIRSRASVLRLEPLTASLVDERITSSAVDVSVSDEAKKLKRERPEEYETVLFSARGSIGRAIDLMTEKTRRPILSSRELAMKFIYAVKGGTNVDHPLTLFSSFSSKRDELSNQLEYIKNALRDLILLKKSDNVELCFFTSRDEGAELSGALSEKRLISVFDEVNHSSEALAANANVRLTLINLLSGL